MVWVWGCMAAPLAAQQVYTLDECIESALLNNARMKNAANDLASARHERKEAFTNYFPSISATGGGFLSSTHLLGMEMGPGMSLDGTRYVVGIDEGWSSGWRYRFDAPLYRRSDCAR